MTNYTELKRLAEAAKEYASLPYYTTHEADFQIAITPDVVLSMIAEIERHRCGTEVLQRLHDEDMAERNKLRTQNQALREALKGLQKQYAEHPDAFWDWSQARAAIKLAEGEDV